MNTKLRLLPLKLLLLIGLTLMINGCWDSSDLGSGAYVTGIGVDYINGQYVVYTQMIDFGAVAKSEEQKTTRPSVWVGRGKGKSINSAIEDIASTAQTSMNLEQIKVVLIRQPAMIHLDAILDALNRVRVARYTAWIFGTKDSILELFNGGSFFGKSELASLLYNPKDQGMKSSFIKSLSMQNFVSAFNEEAMTALLPSVKINNKIWKKNKEKMPIEIIDGIFTFKGKEDIHHFPLAHLIGIRWMNSNFQRHVIVISAGGNLASLAVRNVKYSIKTTIKDGQPSFLLKLSLTGELNEMDGELGIAAINKEVQQVIKEEILQTYNYGVKKKVDLFNLNESFFRYHAKEWKKLQAAGGWQPSNNDLKVQVKFTLKNSGGFQLK
ncbi:spore germination protein A3 [Paenibacillus baekrokdamisoli]|uniref:Spore germination protein A3 n=1 Tax=Paenibacillus baekrokdamisoli TaxID=1712516 RepID=A0A3G9IJK5_9BACL|nr:Ger(x)C family spore germination protein [Paenibacillus baekrokdamisoli]MBB3067727.1 Ger(x)C family germination protein [Paenibacillus baekrokdamisoli]BBH19090.1 spore germination protein A3 [Paenibacillus baekrokdamisoli]